MRRASAAIAITMAFLLTAADAGTAASLQPVGSFEQPMYVTSDPAAPERLFVAERAGRIVEAAPGGRAVFADFRDLVACCESERGLLSIAVSPDFATSGRIYAAYTGEPAAGGAEGDVHLDSFRRAGDSLVREPILTIPHSAQPNHNGGQLQFGPDGRLYIAVGDGGGGGDPLESGQSLDTMLGKLLRIGPRPGQAPSYAVPSDNPLVGEPGLDEIWAYGLRNPWRFSFDRLSGDLVVADVGQGAREEVDRAASPAPGVVGGAGANYGWDCREGLLAYTGPPDAPSEACGGAGPFTDPVFDYPHTDPGDGTAHGCSITGGFVVRDPAAPALGGRYVYGDYCTGQIRSIDLSAPDPRTTDRAEPGLEVPAFSLYSFGEDSCGRVYAVTGGGEVYRLVEGVTDCPGREATRAPRAVRRPAAIRVLVRKRRANGGRFRLAVRVRPCAGNRGRRVLLKRGGRRFGAKRLNRRCVARFRVRVRRRSTFRAVLRLGPGLNPVRSRRVVIGGAAHRRRPRIAAAGR